MAVNPNTGVQVIHLNTVTPAQVSVNYGPAFAVNVAGDHRHDYSEIDNAPTIPSAPQDIGAQPAGDYAAADHDHDGVYVKPDDLPDPPDLSGYVQDDDPRLSDERDPTEHQHNYSDISDPPAIPATPEDIGAQPAGDYASAGHHHDGTYQPVGDYLTADDLPAPPDLSDVVREDDPRLSDARPPTAHSHPEYLTTDDLPEVPDLSEFVTDDDPRLSDAREPTAHSHSEYLTAEDLPAPPDLSDVIREGDERLSDPRQPTSHRHNWGDLDGAPSIPQTPEDIGAQPAGEYLTASNFQIAGIAVNPTETPPDGWLVIRTDGVEATVSLSFVENGVELPAGLTH